MNKQIDEVYMILLKAKENIIKYTKEKVKNKDWIPYYNGIVEKIDNIINDYATITKLSTEEILGSLFEIGADDKNSIFYDDYNNVKMNL